MAIIYSYPSAGSLQGSDIIVITRFDEDQNNQARTMNANIDAILGYVSNNYSGSQNLDDVLAVGNISLLDASIGTLYLYNDHAPSGNGYVSIYGNKNRINFIDNTSSTIGYISQGTLYLRDFSTNYGIFIQKPSVATGNRFATFQDASGTVAYLSDIPATKNYGLYAGIADGQNIAENNSEITLIPDGVGSLSVPANGFSVGDSFRGVFSGTFSSANNQICKIKVYINNIEILSSGDQSITSTTNDTFYLNLDFTIRSIGETGQVASIASFHYTKQSNDRVEGFSFSDIVEIDTTIENTLNVTFQWENSLSANSIQTKTFVLNKVY